MIALEARDLVIEVGGKIVVRDLSFDLRAGDKIGVVGRNGAGKTSTMKVLAGEEEPGGGTLVRRGAVGYLRQDPRQHRAEDDDLALEHVLEARGLVDLSRRLEKARVGLAESHDERSIRRFSRLEEEYTMLGGYQAEATAKTIVAGLGLAEDRLRLPVKTLSGGERRRLELAKILFGGSDVLLLDEPTNHLDVDAKTWLMKFLASYKGALMVISHDIGLLDASITRILHLDVEGVVEYKGTYTQYRTARARGRAAAHQARRASDRRDQTAQDARRQHARADGQACARWRSRSTPASPGWNRRRSKDRPARSACASGSPSRPTAAAPSWPSRTWRSPTADRRCSPTSRSRSDAGSGC